MVLVTTNGEPSRRTLVHTGAEHKYAERHVACLYTLEIGQKCLRTAVPATNSSQNQNNLLLFPFFLVAFRTCVTPIQLTLAIANEPIRCREMTKSVRCVCATLSLDGIEQSNAKYCVFVLHRKREIRESRVCCRCEHTRVNM